METVHNNISEQIINKFRNKINGLSVEFEKVYDKYDGTTTFCIVNINEDNKIKAVRELDTFITDIENKFGVPFVINFNKQK